MWKYCGMRVKLTTIALIVSLVGYLVSCRESAKTDDLLMKEFVQSVMEAGKLQNLNRLVDLSLYKQSDLEWLAKQYGPKDATPALETETRKEAEENATVFLDSYADLFANKVFRLSWATIDSSIGADVYALVIWVGKDGHFQGILINRIGKVNGRLKVAEWVEVSGYEAAHGLKKKRAVLLANNEAECQFPTSKSIEYRSTIIGDQELPSGQSGYSPIR
jgi:hypothetical protein